MPLQHTKEQIVQVVLEEFRKLLPERSHSSARMDNSPSSPTEVYVVQMSEQPDVLQRSGGVLARWRVKNDEIVALPVSSDEATRGQPRGMLYERFTGDFAISENLSQVWINWTVGPLFARGFRYDVVADDSGIIRLQNPQMTWMS